MPKQAGDLFIEGTIDDLTFYKMCGKYYVRMKTSLTGKRFWKDKVFEGSRKSCSRFGEGNRLASTVFKLVREEKRTNRLFPFLSRRAIALLKEGRDRDEVMWVLVDYLVDFGFLEIRSVRKENRCVDFSSVTFSQGWLGDKYFIVCLADPSFVGTERKSNQKAQGRRNRIVADKSIILFWRRRSLLSSGFACPSVPAHCNTPIIFSGV